MHTVDSGNVWLKENSIIGRCNYKLHRGFMTKNSIEHHHCLEKNCPFLQKYLDKPYWQNLKSAELQKAKNKAEKQNKKMQKKLLEDKLDCIKLIAEQLVGELSIYNIYITRLEKVNENKCRIYFVSDSSKGVDLYFARYICLPLSKMYDFKFEFRQTRNIDGKFATYNQWINRPKR